MEVESVCSEGWIDAGSCGESGEVSLDVGEDAGGLLSVDEERPGEGGG
jgi:hypothetical protein